jgi:SHS2 domain-containing protein
MYETFDHTADLGLRIRAADLSALFAEAGLALTSLLVEDPAAVRGGEARVEVKLPPDDLQFLLFDWLKALLSRFETDRLLFSRFEVKVVSAEAGLDAVAWGERCDESRHELSHEVKAITYHGLKVVREADGGGWLAEVIVDI